MKLKKVRVRNFLSLRDATIEFHENGVHHIVGANNVGKSALLKVLDALFNNVSKLEYKDFLRDGTNTFTIEAEFYDGNTVKLSRGATDYYEWCINGEEGRLDKTNGHVPEVLTRYFNLYTDNEKTKECLNIRLPRDVLTFVDTSKAESYFLLQKAMRTEEYLLASKKAEARKREIAQEQKTIQSFIERDSEQVSQAESQLVQLKQAQDEINQQMQIIETEYALFQEIEQLFTLAQNLGTIDEQIRDITNGIDLERGEQLKQEIEEFELINQTLEIMKQISDSNKRVKALEEVVQNNEEFYQVTTEVQALNELMQTFEQYASVNQQVKVKQQEVEQAQKKHQDFMVANNFCPIVLNTLDQKCPFTKQSIS